MEQKHTPEPWKVIEPTAWPWGIDVADNKDCLVLRLDMPCHSTSDESLADVMSGKCFDRFGGRDDAAAANAAQMEKARRIVACVNACEGLSTDELERFGLASAFGTELLEIEKQRNQLLAALEEVIRISDRKHDAWDNAKAAIAAVKGGA